MMLVRAKGVALVPVYRAIGMSPRRYLGRAYDATLGDAGGWPSTGECVEVTDHFAEYRAHVRDGDLWPGDEETARACGVAFDPTFGGDL